jgi:hypothetical protein
VDSNEKLIANQFSALNAALDKYAPLVNMEAERAISRQSRTI